MALMLIPKEDGKYYIVDQDSISVGPSNEICTAVVMGTLDARGSFKVEVYNPYQLKSGLLYCTYSCPKDVETMFCELHGKQQAALNPEIVPYLINGRII